jgi:hypothetical protein
MRTYINITRSEVIAALFIAIAIMWLAMMAIGLGV